MNNNFKLSLLVSIPLVVITVGLLYQAYRYSEENQFENNGAYVDDVYHVDKYADRVYSPDGTYLSEVLDSYRSSYAYQASKDTGDLKGIWFIVPVTGNKYLLYTKDDSINSNDIDPSLRPLINGETLNGIGIIDFETVTENPAVQSNIKSLEYLKSNYPVFTKLIHKRWLKNTAEDSYFRPMELVFFTNFTYFAQFASGCTVTDTYGFSSRFNEISLSLDGISYCDERRNNDDPVLDDSYGVRFEITDTELLTEPYTYNGYKVSD